MESLLSGKSELDCEHDAEALITEILNIHETLRKKTLTPTPELSLLFHQLINTTSCTRTEIMRKILDSEKIKAITPELRCICAEGETALETVHAKTIINSNDPWSALEAYPYFTNYLEMLSLELSGIYAISATLGKSAAFIGSGPLPLTAILLAKKYGLAITCVDRNEHANTLARAVILKLGLSSRIQFVTADIFAVTALPYDHIFLAALVGINADEKKKAVEHIAEISQKTTTLILRTSQDLRTLIYQPIPLDAILPLTKKIILQPLGAVVNSIIIAQP